MNQNLNEAKKVDPSAILAISAKNGYPELAKGFRQNVCDFSLESKHTWAAAHRRIMKMNESTVPGRQPGGKLKADGGRVFQNREVCRGVGVGKPARLISFNYPTVSPPEVSRFQGGRNGTRRKNTSECLEGSGARY